MFTYPLCCWCSCAHYQPDTHNNGGQRKCVTATKAEEWYSLSMNSLQSFSRVSNDEFCSSVAVKQQPYCALALLAVMFTNKPKRIW